ncbi:hypothetical protein SIN_0678 [Streptococcus infantis SK1302]|uniref:Uncharacterized protein n=1 Tax=Streptococcus infantis SK1302 TaxID=871237 RepID=A0ABN0B623_9STRE|nr:hypothetical protein SIN_0678 [Streptococcus infantis SK1302]
MSQEIAAIFDIDGTILEIHFFFIIWRSALLMMFSQYQ